MRYQMKQKIFALGDDFTIVDSDGRAVATVDGKVFSLGNKLAFLDPQGRELALIRQKLISLKPSYEITRSGTLSATVSKDFFSLFRCSFTVDVPGPDDLEAKGSFTPAYSRRRQEPTQVIEIAAKSPDNEFHPG